MESNEFTPEQKRDIFYHGGLRETVTLAGHEIVLGELAQKDRFKIFECFERDIIASHKAYREYVKEAAPNIFKALFYFVIGLFGIERKQTSAVGVMKKFVEGLTESDIVLIQVCASGRNGELTDKQVRDIVMDSPPSEVQVAIRKALEINGIDVKKFQAARQATVPTVTAKTTTSTAGSAE